MTANHEINLDQAARLFRSVFGTATFEARQNVVDAVDRYANELERERTEVTEAVETESFEFLNELALAFRAAENHPRPQCAPVLEGVRAVLAHLDSAGRLLADDEQRLTAEQVEDMRIVLGLNGSQDIKVVLDAQARLRALFPATEPTEDSVGDPLQAWKEFLKPKPIGWYSTMTREFATEHFGFPEVTGLLECTHTASDGSTWGWGGDGDWELLIYPSAPAEPAEDRLARNPEAVADLKAYAADPTNTESVDLHGRGSSADGDCFEVCEGHPVGMTMAHILHHEPEPAEAEGNPSEFPNSSPTVVHVHHHDIEAHAASFNEGYDEAMRQFAEPESVDIESLIEKSSLGRESAQAAIDSVSPEHGRLIVAVAEQRAKTEALAKFMYEHGNPELSEEDREILRPWEGVDEVTQKIWMNLADGAYIHIADEIDSEKELLTEKVGQLQKQVKHLSRVAVNAAEHGIPAPAEPAEEETKAEGLRKFRKKPVEVEAMQYDGKDWRSIAQWMAAHGAPMGRTASGLLRIHTLEGEMTAHPGDWIIKGTQGEFYPCKPAPFADTFEPASSPVVPAPTETEWQTWQEVPEGVKYSPKARPPAGSPLRLLAQPLWVNRGGTRHQARSGTVSKIGDVEMFHYAPFVAAEER